MVPEFSFRHLFALYFAFANCIGLILAPLRGTRSVISLYGLPPSISNIPETWPVWQAGQGRIVLLGLLMFVFYWRREYKACDTLLMGAVWLGVNDFVVFWNLGDTYWSVFRLVGSFVFGAVGYYGITQGPGTEMKAR